MATREKKNLSVSFAKRISKAGEHCEELLPGLADPSDL